MAKLLQNRWAQLAGVSILTALVVALAVYLVMSDSGGSTGLSTGDHVSFTSGGAVRGMRRVVDAIDTIESVVPSEALPLTASEAVAAGWKDPVLCDSGRGRFFQKEGGTQIEPYYLMYSHEDRLIGV